MNSPHLGCELKDFNENQWGENQVLSNWGEKYILVDAFKSTQYLVYVLQ